MSSGSLVFRSQRGYDASSNVTAVNTTLAAGTDSQIFCYDEQNRLTWAGSSGTPSCGTTLTPGTLSSASYTQTYAYDTLDRLTSGPLGSYSYGDSAHLHAATSIGTSYQAAYDAVGEMICRAPTSATNCAVPSGALLSYDNEGRLSHWQNAPTSPSTTDDFLYDGAGNRVEQQATISGSPVTTIYVAGGLEEVTTTGSTTTLTKYFSVPGLPTIERVGTNGPLSYLASDGQGSVSETLDGSGTVTFQQLFTPYGTTRYSNGSSPTTLGYTGQRADASTGLDYYQARYYDPAAGQFTSADTANDGLNRYGYAAGNPTTNTDPTGHMVVASDDYDGVYQPPIMGPVDCHTNNTCPPPPPSKTPTATPTATPKPTPLTGGDGSTPTSCGGLVCGLKDPAQFAAGLGLVIGGIGVFAAALAGLIWSFSNPFAKFAISLATSAVEKGAGVLAQIISQGLQMVLNAFVQVNPWLRVIVDIFSVLTDIAAMALSFLAGLSAVLERGRATMTLVEKWSFVVKGILNHESSTSVFALAKDALAESALGIFSGFGSFLADVFRLRDDLNVAMSSS